jgi:hypothetical protein
VDLDGSQTKAELVEQVMALEAQASGTTSPTGDDGTEDGSTNPSSDVADLAALELGDALL